MRRGLLVIGVALWAGLAAASPPTKADGGCGSHGTALEFVSTPAEAAKLAAKQEKLVFVLHVSGDFEDPGRT